MRNRMLSRHLTLMAILTAIFIASLFSAAHSQADPVLEVSPDTLRFYADFCGGSPMPGDTAYNTFMVANIGGGSMTWTGTAGESWVAFDPTQGGNYDSVYAWIDWSMVPQIFAAPQPGDTLIFETQIVIEAPGAANSPQPVVVQLLYTCEPAEYHLVAYPNYFQLAAAPGDTLFRWFHVVEAHGARIDFSFANNSNWLFLPQTFAPVYTPDSVEFVVWAGGLDPGVYYDTITITSSEASNIVTIPVQLTIGEGEFTLASIPAYFNFTVPQGVPILGESLYVYEVAGNAINFWTYNQAYWLYVDTMDASPLYTPRLLFVDIYADTLEPGAYTDTILVYGEGVADPLLIPVSVIVEGGPDEYQIATNPTFYHLNVPPDITADTILSVYEIHGYETGFIATYVAPWLNISGGPFHTTPATLDLTINTAGLAPGFYADSIFIFPDTDSYSFPPIAVPVYVQVREEGAVVHADPNYFFFSLAPGDTIPQVSMLIYEESGDSIAFGVEVAGESSWLYLPLDLSFGVTPGSFSFGIYTDGLAPGAYGDSLVIYYPLDDQYGFDDVIVPVILTIEGDPPAYDLQTDPTSFSFDLNEGGYGYDSLWVYDIYRNQIPFYFYNSQPWLAVDPLGMFPYLTPASLLVIANASGLAPGLYIDTIFIQSLVEDSSAIQTLAVPVMMTVDGFRVCGDANGDNTIDIGDAVYLVDYVFREGSAPASFKSADTNLDGTVNIGDIVVIVGFIFRSGPPPACP